MNKKVFLPMLIFQLLSAEQMSFVNPNREESKTLDEYSKVAPGKYLQTAQQSDENFNQNTLLRNVYKMQKNPVFLEYKFSQTGWPIVDFLKNADSVAIDVWYGVFRAISNSTKSCLYIRSGALNNILGAAEAYLVPYVEKLRVADEEKVLESKVAKVVRAALNDMTNKPIEKFSSALSRDIVKIYQEHKAEPIGQYALMIKEQFYGFADSVISRTVWEAGDYSTVWDSLLTTANYLYQMSSLLETYDKLDNLIISLVHAFSRYLEFNCETLPISFLQSIKESILQREAFFLAEVESDDFVVSKKDYLLKKIAECIEKKKQQEIKPWQDGNHVLAMSESIASQKPPSLFSNV